MKKSGYKPTKSYPASGKDIMEENLNNKYDNSITKTIKTIPYKEKKKKVDLLLYIILIYDENFNSHNTKKDK